MVGGFKPLGFLYGSVVHPSVICSTMLYFCFNFLACCINACGTYAYSLLYFDVLQAKAKSQKKAEAKAHH